MGKLRTFCLLISIHNSVLNLDSPRDIEKEEDKKLQEENFIEGIKFLDNGRKLIKILEEIEKVGECKIVKGFIMDKLESDEHSNKFRRCVLYTDKDFDIKKVKKNIWEICSYRYTDKGQLEITLKDGKENGE